MTPKQESRSLVIQDGFQTFSSGEVVVSIAGETDKPEELQNFENLTRKLNKVSKTHLDEKRETAGGQ